MRVVVVGAGAIGTVLAGSLAVAGHSVTLVVRPAYTERIRSDGLRIEDGSGTTTVRVHVEERPPPEGEDLAILAVKTFDLADAARSLRSVRPLPVLLPQNGLGIERTADAALRDAGWPEPRRYLVRAVNSVPATALAPKICSKSMAPCRTN